MTNKGIAEFIYGFCDMGAAAELPEEEAIATLEKAVAKSAESEYSLSLHDYLTTAAMNCEGKTDLALLISAFDQFEDAGKYLDGTTANGTKLAKIAQLLLSLQDMGTIMQFDDEMHYFLIGEGLKKADPVLLYYLSNGTENILQEENKMKKWVIVIHGTDIDTDVYKFSGTEQETKELLVRLCADDRKKDPNWRFGTESVDEINYLDNGVFYAVGVYEGTFCIDYVAFPDKEIREIPNQKEVPK